MGSLLHKLQKCRVSGSLSIYVCEEFDVWPVGTWFAFVWLCRVCTRSAIMVYKYSCWNIKELFSGIEIDQSLKVCKKKHIYIRTSAYYGAEGAIPIYANALSSYTPTNTYEKHSQCVRRVSLCVFRKRNMRPSASDPTNSTFFSLECIYTFQYITHLRTYFIYNTQQNCEP